jgi:hypothetical protein
MRFPIVRGNLQAVIDVHRNERHAVHIAAACQRVQQNGGIKAAAEGDKIAVDRITAVQVGQAMQQLIGCERHEGSAAEIEELSRDAD